MSSKIIISLLRSETVDSKGKPGYVNVAKWTKKEGGTFSIWEGKKPIFDILNSEEMFFFMKGSRIEIKKELFDVAFFDNTYSDYFKDTEKWEESFYCYECGSDSERDFVYERSVANGEIWHCKNCKKETRVDHKPNQDDY